MDFIFNNYNKLNYSDEPTNHKRKLLTIWKTKIFGLTEIKDLKEKINYN